MCIWKDRLVIGMGQMITFIPSHNSRPEEKADQLVAEEHECPAEIISMCTFTGSSGESYLVLGCMDGKLRFYQQHEDGTIHKVRSIRAHKSRISSLLVSEDGIFTGSGGSDGTIKYWKLSDEENKDENGLAYTLSGHSDAVRTMSRMGPYLVSGSNKQDGSLRVWDLEEHQCIQARLTPHEAIHATLVLSDSVMITGGNGGDRKLCIWTTDHLKKCQISTRLVCGIQ